MQRIERIMIAVLLIALAWVWNANAGTEPGGPGTPPESTNSYTIEDVYQRLNLGTAGSESAFSEPSVAAGTGTMHTLNDVMGVAPAQDDAAGATVADVASGKTFWGLNAGSSEWGLQTGTASGGSSTYEAGVPKTGAGDIEEYEEVSGEDGHPDMQKGVAWPDPRFTDNSDGTVTDNLTGLIWLTNANCANATRTWATALTDVTQLNTDGKMNSNDCGDSSNSGSHQTDWRLPNVRELHSLIHYGYVSPALSNAAGTGPWTDGEPFSNVHSSFYWSSSTYSNNPTLGWYVNLNSGYAYRSVKTDNSYYVWPVRGGQ